MLTFALLRTHRLLLSDVLAFGILLQRLFSSYSRPCPAETVRERTVESTLKARSTAAVRVGPDRARRVVRYPCRDRLQRVRPARWTAESTFVRKKRQRVANRTPRVALEHEAGRPEVLGVHTSDIGRGATAQRALISAVHIL